jgi:hypothetical protein
MLALLLVLTAVAYLFGGPPVNVEHENSLTRNRILAGIGMFAVTSVLSYWMSGTAPAES